MYDEFSEYIIPIPVSNFLYSPEFNVGMYLDVSATMFSNSTTQDIRFQYETGPYRVLSEMIQRGLIVPIYGDHDGNPRCIVDIISNAHTRIHEFRVRVEGTIERELEDVKREQHAVDEKTKRMKQNIKTLREQIEELVVKK